MSGGDDPDSCIPAPLRDFVFDLHDSSRRSHVKSEQASLYNGTFRELSAKYYSNTPWPSPDSISADCGADPLFLAFYKELTHRHLHSISHVQLSDRIDGWHVYCKLFDLLLNSCPTDTTPDDGPNGDPGLFIAPDWAFDILHEFVYQFQGFCQFRTQTATSAAKQSGAGKSSSHVSEAMDFLNRNRDAWAVETVLFYLHRLVSVGASVDPTKNSVAAYRYLGIFASVVLSRLECLLGDYRASLKALEPLHVDSNKMSVMDEVFQAKVSAAYHAGVSYLMLRRYKDAIRVLGNICSDLKRGFNAGQLSKLPGSDQFGRLSDRMIALLAVLTHICPSHKLEDNLINTIRDKYGGQLSKIEAGEEGYEDLFTYACPKFISPAVPDYDNLVESGDNAYNLQVKQFMNEMREQSALRKSRSYVKLYTSIKVEKLAAFNDTDEQEFVTRLLCYKHKMRQLECGIVEEKEDEDGASGNGPLDGTIKSCLDIHYYIKGDMVHVSNEQKTGGFETFFLKGIKQNEEIVKDAKAIDISM